MMAIVLLTVVELLLEGKIFYFRQLLLSALSAMHMSMYLNVLSSSPLVGFRVRTSLSRWYIASAAFMGNHVGRKICRNTRWSRCCLHLRLLLLSNRCNLTKFVSVAVLHVYFAWYVSACVRRDTRVVTTKIHAHSLSTGSLLAGLHYNRHRRRRRRKCVIICVTYCLSVLLLRIAWQLDCVRIHY